MASAAPPTEFFESIHFNLSFYTAGDSSVSLNYVNSSFLRCSGYAYSRAISTSFNGILYCLGGIDTTNINASGLITSTTGFKGNGAQLTNLNATNISDGTLNVARGGTGCGEPRGWIGLGIIPSDFSTRLPFDVIPYSGDNRLGGGDCGCVNVCVLPCRYEGQSVNRSSRSLKANLLLMIPSCRLSVVVTVYDVGGGMCV